MTDLSPGPPDETSLQLAFDAARDILKTQDGTLGNLRSRATSLLTVAALLTSFSTGLGLLNTDRARGEVLATGAAWLILLVLLGIGALVLSVLWPARGWHFGPSPTTILAEARAGRSPGDIRLLVTTKMTEGMAANSATLKRRQSAFRWAVALLILEASILVLGLTIA